MEKANIRIYFSIILQTRLGSERLVVIALLICRINDQVGAQLHGYSYFRHTSHMTVDLTNSSEGFIIFSKGKRL